MGAALILAGALLVGGLALLVRWVDIVSGSRALSRGERALAVLVVGSVGALCVLIAVFAVAADPRPLDVSAHALLGARFDDPRVRTALALTLLGDWRLHFAVLLGIGVPLLRRTHGWPLAVYGAALAATGISVLALKSGIARARPAGMLIVVRDLSFPSGHAAMGLAFWFAVGALVGRRGGGWRVVGVLLATAVPAAVGWTRLFLRVHWVSDIAGGFMIALFWLTLAVLADGFSEEVPALAAWRKRLSAGE